MAKALRERVGKQYKGTQRTRNAVHGECTVELAKWTFLVISLCREPYEAKVSRTGLTGGMGRRTVRQRALCLPSNASDKTLNATLLSEITQRLACYGVQPGAYIYIADAALVTEDNLTALLDTLFVTRLPATYSECGRVIAEAVAHNRWEEVGVLAQTPPTKHRPGTFYKVAAGKVTLY